MAFYTVDAWGPRVGAGDSQPRWVTINGIAKVNTPASPFCVANEFVCGRLALMLGLPVPPGVIAHNDDGTPIYLALRYGPSSERLAPGNDTMLVQNQPHWVGGIAAFDCWVGNQDRSRSNFAYHQKVLQQPIFFDMRRPFSEPARNRRTTSASD